MRLSSVEATVHGLKDSPPTMHPLKCASLKRFPLKESWSSGIFRPEQPVGHSKWTLPPRARTISDNLKKKFKSLRLSSLCAISFRLNSGANLRRFNLCQLDQGLQGKEPHKSTPFKSSESSTSRSCSCTSNLAISPLAFVRRTCLTPTDSDTFPRWDWGPQQNSTNTPYAGFDHLFKLFPFLCGARLRLGLLLSTQGINGSTRDLIRFRQKLKHRLTSPKFFESLGVTLPVYIYYSIFGPTVEILYNGRPFSKPFGFDRKIFRQQGAFCAWCDEIEWAYFLQASTNQRLWQRPWEV